MVTAKLLVAPSKADVPAELNSAIVPIAAAALKERGAFTIALSGGSLPGFLSALPQAFSDAGVEPQFDKWTVVLADERCVPATDGDSNLGSLQEKFFSKVEQLSADRIIGIDESKLTESTAAVAEDYELKFRKVLEEVSGGSLDLAVLGFGPDGHTCSLFPGHALLKEETLWVAPIEDSPKPPPKRITLTYPVLNTKTRHVIFCGAGGSKKTITQAVFASVAADSGTAHTATMTEPAPYPCAMVAPSMDGSSLTWVVDKDAMEGITIS